MKLVIAVVQGTDVELVMEALCEAGFSATQITSAGGFLRETNETLLVGAEASEVPIVVSIVDQHSTARKMFVNPLMPFAPVVDSSSGEDSEAVRVGASVFVLNVSRFERLTG